MHVLPTLVQLMTLLPSTSVRFSEGARAALATTREVVGSVVADHAIHASVDGRVTLRRPEDGLQGFLAAAAHK